MSFFEDIRTGSVAVFFISLIYACSLCAASMDDGVRALNEGRLREACEIFSAVGKDQRELPLNRGIAYKNLGTALFRLGQSFQKAFDTSEKIFLELLQKKSTPEVKRQYAYLLYQRANCLLTACENQLSKAKMQGISSIPFDYLKNYLHPVSVTLKKIKTVYPEKQRGDLLLLELDLLLTEVHIWEACRQEGIAARSREKAIAYVNTALKHTSFAPDAKKKLLLRKAMLLCSLSRPSDAEISKTLTGAIGIESGNVELDISVFTFYAKYTLMRKSPLTSAEYDVLEKKLRDAIAKIERLREQNLKNMDFAAKKSYFATRTELYEVLLRLYAQQKRPFDMLLAINQVRSRAIQDEISAGKIASQRQLQKILSENRGMLLAYYVGCDHIWMVCFTGNSAEISRSKRSGQELAAMCMNIIQVYSDVRHLQSYMRYGPRYKTVPDAFAMSHFVYKEIFLQHHQKFNESKLEHLYIIPHNVLNYLPFTTLAVKTDTANVLNTFFVADERIPVSYFASVNSLLPAKTSFEGRRRNVVLARGNYSFPAFYNEDPENPDNPNAPPLNLPKTLPEGKTVAKILAVADEDFLTEKNASEFNLVQRMANGCSVVHIASHAHLNARSPLDSYVVLAAGHGCDGKVKVQELLSKYKGRMHADLLVLSGCDTNLGEKEKDIVPGDDIAALSNAFLVAGARNVVATAWPAVDDTFPEIMGQFHSFLAKGGAKDISLADALKTYLSKARGGYRYPLFWGNIVLNGGLQKK